MSKTAEQRNYICDLALAEARRRKGMATVLIEEHGNIARTSGAWVDYVQADYGNEPAIALYTRLGCEQRLRCTSMPRVFGKPVTRPYRRMAVALARANDGYSDEARAAAMAAASKITID